MKYFKTGFLSLLTFGFASCGISQKTKQLTIRASQSNPYYNSGIARIDSFPLWSYKIWLKDSSVIFESRTHYQSIDHLRDSDVIKESYPVFAYVYLDLITMRAQSYIYLSDTATPVNNYLFLPQKGQGSTLHPFYNLPQKSDTIEMSVMADTILAGNVYKRFKTHNSNLPVPQRHYDILYADKRMPKTIYHINPTIDNLIGKGSVTRIESYTDNNEPFYVFQFEISEQKLTDYQLRIFNQWAKNATDSKLPLLPFSEALKIRRPGLIHENPTIRVLLKKKE